MTLTRPGAAQTPAGGRPKVASKPSTARRDEAVRAASSASAYQSALVLGGASVMTRPRAVGRRFAPAPDLAASSRRHLPQSVGDSLRGGVVDPGAHAGLGAGEELQPPRRPHDREELQVQATQLALVADGRLEPGGDVGQRGDAVVVAVGAAQEL